MSFLVVRNFWVGRTNYLPGQPYLDGDVKELLSKGLIAHQPEPEVFHVEQPASDLPMVADAIPEAPKKGKKKKG